MNAPSNSIVEIRLDAVRGGAQMRIAGIDPAIVGDYAEAMEGGATFPPVVVFHDGGVDYFLGDGFHRVEAAKRIGRTEITAEVRSGTQRDAVLYAVGAHAHHGLRRTAEDKRRAIETMLRDPAWAKWSDREIGKACAVDHKTVGRVRRELSGEFPTDRTVTFRDRHGNEAEMHVPVAAPAGSTMVEKMLGKATAEALLAECERRGWQVRQ